MFTSHLAAMRGTREHKFAQDAIELGFKMADNRKTINMYINDSIGWRMSPEVALYFSDFCFGTADALGFRENTLRVSDYKSGRTPTKFDQLEIYDALFCLEYDMDPFEINIENRIYQSNDIRLDIPDPEKIFFTMRRIISANKILENMQRDANI